MQVEPHWRGEVRFASKRLNLQAFLQNSKIAQRGDHHLLVKKQEINTRPPRLYPYRLIEKLVISQVDK
jgi:hypothetical protein